MLARFFSGYLAAHPEVNPLHAITILFHVLSAGFSSSSSLHEMAHVVLLPRPPLASPLATSSRRG